MVLNAKRISKLACWGVKAIITTSTAIALLNTEQKALRDAILQNRAAIDFLLLKHHVDCEVMHKMWCFNLINNYNSIQDRLHSLHSFVQQVKESNVGDGWWERLTSWLPNLDWLKSLFVYGIIIIIACIVLCCCAQCIPNLYLMFQGSCQTQATAL